MVTRRRFPARRGSAPSRQWTEVSSTFLANDTATTATVLWGLQSPSAAVGLQALPPADVVIMRVLGRFSCSLSVSATWVLGLTVQDQTWTPGASFEADADKRWLWTRTVQNTTGGAVTWTQDGQFQYLQTAVVNTAWAGDTTLVDISPKVKLEAGQGLYLVKYEVAGAATLTISTAAMRMLWQEKRR